MSEIDPMDTDEAMATDAGDGSYDGYADTSLDDSGSYESPSYDTAGYDSAGDDGAGYEDTGSYDDPAGVVGDSVTEEADGDISLADDPAPAIPAAAAEDAPVPTPVLEADTSTPPPAPDIALVDPMLEGPPPAPPGADSFAASVDGDGDTPFDIAPSPHALDVDTDGDLSDDLDQLSSTDLHDWQRAYDDWQTAVTTTGHAPTLGGLDDIDRMEGSDAGFDTTADDGTVVGEPFADTQFWFQQNTAFTCGPASATQIISDFTGNVHLDESALYAYADQRGWMVDADMDGTIDGMSIQHLSQLMSENGVPNQVVSGDVEDLEVYLSEGRSIVLFLDNENLPGMHELDGAENSAADDPNHFVRLTGIDTARGIAYLSDPGRADGQNLVVPLDMLKEAWNDSNNYMVVTDGADPTADGGPTTTDGTPTTTDGTPTTTDTEMPDDETPAADLEEAAPDDREAEPARAPAPPATRPAPARPATAEPTMVRTETVTTSVAPAADVAPLDLGISEQVDEMLRDAADAATPPVDLSTPSSQPDGLFDSALGFVLIPVAVSAGVAGTLGYRQLRSRS